MEKANHGLKITSRVPPITRCPPVVTVKPGPPNRFAIVSESLFGIWTHWDGKHTIPCFEGTRQCQNCMRQLPKRWKGLLQVLLIERRTNFFLELTPLSGKMLLEQLPTKSKMRGRIIYVGREREHIRAPLKVEVTPDYFEGEIPPATDAILTLEKIWGLGMK